MALLNLTRLAVKDLFTADLWNNLMDILEAKFAGGVSEADLSWPLVVQGDIDFGQTYGLVALRSLWGVVNAGEYANLEAAIAATSGGNAAVFIPPNETIECSAATVSSSDVTIFGAGPTSIIKITASGTGPMIQTAAAGVSNFRIMNCTLDGTGSGAGCVGVKLQKATRPQLLNVYMLGFTGDFIYVTNGGSAGDKSVDVLLDNIHCSGGSDSHLVADDVTGMLVQEFVSKSATGDAISMVPSGATNLLQDIVIANARIQGGGAKGIRIVGSGAAGIVAHSRIQISDCQVVDMTGLPFELGNTSALLKDVRVSNCFANDAAASSLRIAADGGSVTGNFFPGSGDDAIDAQNSVDVDIHGNNCQNATAYGVDASSTTDCTVTANNFRGCASGGVKGTSATGLRQGANVGALNPSQGTSYVDWLTSYTKAATDIGDMGFTYTIPGNTIRPGDILVVSFLQAGTGTGTGSVKAGGQDIGTFSHPGVDCQTTCKLYVESASNSRSYIVRLEGDTSDQIAVGTDDAITTDWTVDNAITFSIATHGGAGNITVKSIQIQVTGSGA